MSAVAVRAERGFTLVEVLAAMTILAVGLLSLQALGLAALRAAALADANTRAVAAATRLAEESAEQLRRGELPEPFTCVTALGDEVDVGAVPTGIAGVAAVRVRVTPRPGLAQPGPYTVSAYGYSPQGFVPAAAALECP